MLSVDKIHARWDDPRPNFIIYNDENESLYRLYLTDVCEINYELYYASNALINTQTTNACVSFNDLLNEHKSRVLLKLIFIRFVDDY